AEVEAIKAGIGAFKARERAQRMAIMVEPAMRLHRCFQRMLSGMAERRMTDIVRKAEGLGQILVEPERASDAATDLCHFDAVGQPNAVMIAVGRNKYLRLVAQPAKGDRMDDAVAVALESVARPAHDPSGLVMIAAARMRRVAGAGRDVAHLIGSTASPASLAKRKPSPPAFL